MVSGSTPVEFWGSKRFYECAVLQKYETDRNLDDAV
jgi:hypothetical protein